MQINKEGDKKLDNQKFARVISQMLEYKVYSFFQDYTSFTHYTNTVRTIVESYPRNLASSVC